LVINRQTLLVLAAIAALAGCRGKHSQQEVKNDEPTAPSARLVSQVAMNDQDVETQLIQGFYPVEPGAIWRWTAAKFAVLLKSPLGAAEKGGTLSLAFGLPEAVLSKTGPMTIVATAGASKLGSETFKDAGQHVFMADLSPELLKQESVTIDFVLDKSLPPGPVEKRELGVIVTSVGLESK
jgi:hypothetical protein